MFRSRPVRIAAVWSKRTGLLGCRFEASWRLVIVTSDRDVPVERGVFETDRVVLARLGAPSSRTLAQPSDLRAGMCNDLDMRLEASEVPDDVWSWLNANGGAVSTIATVITALVAIGALYAAARDSRERSRPYLAAELVPARNSGSSVAFRIVNYGTTSARDISVTFDPPITATADDNPASNIRLRYERPVAHLSPGQSLGNVWQTFAANGKTSTVPDECAVTLTYRGAHRRTFVDTYQLSLHTVSLESESTASNSQLGAVRRIATSLEALVKKK